MMHNQLFHGHVSVRNRSAITSLGMTTALTRNSSLDSVPRDVHGNLDYRAMILLGQKKHKAAVAQARKEQPGRMRS